MSSTVGMPLPKPPLNLTLIVAATLNNGIGKNGSLPWRLRAEMQYFARVTTRLPPQYASMPITEVQNAVIMGRKTWESIPTKFRPLKDRLNVVLTSKVEGSSDRKLINGAVWVKSLEDALDLMDTLKADGEAAGHDDLPRVARAYIIGGANVYKSALDLPNGMANRVLLTRVHSDFECDTFFPAAFDRATPGQSGWQRRSNVELSEFVGEDVKKGLVTEGKVEYEYCLYEREGTGG